MKVKYIDHLGSDLTVVNAARVSFNKESDYLYQPKVDEHGDLIDEWNLDNRDKKLINYLGQHGHWTPFGHPQISLHFKVPIFVARQVHKHQVGFVVNEVSRRYVSEKPEFYIPDSWRLKAKDKKQGSSEEISPFNEEFIKDYIDRCESLVLDYQILTEDQDISPEQARMVLPLSTYTEFWMTGSLAAWARLYNLRIQPDAQKEVQEVAKQIGEIVEPRYPVSWSALTNEV